jgi:hypothetical protein
MSDNPLELQWYLLQLNLHREGADNVLKWITSRSLSYLWQRIYPIIWASVAAIIISAIISLINHSAGVFGVGAALGLGGISSFVKKLDIENKPPDLTLGGALKMPDYSKKLGYIHAAMEDLQIIFRTIPNHYRPIIIFVDDLDRCSPEKVAEVVEGINLFLAGDFQAKFVIGMDTEMVAASLEAAHSQTISKLPEYSKHIPVGWRFMDKFIQLPILLPPIRELGMRKYVRSIMNQNIPESGKDVNNSDDTKSKNQGTVDETQRTTTDRESSTVETNTSYDDPELINMISKAAAEFSVNPRDIKRFINLLRYYYLVRKRMIEKYPNQNFPTMDQLRRWILLLLRWPQIVRWLYLYEVRRDELEYNSTSIRLLQLEKLARNSKSETDWIEKLKSELNISNVSDGVSFWVTDKNLRQFFRNETQIGNEKPLSSSAGLGVY